VSCRAPPSARHEEPRTGGRTRPAGDRPGRPIVFAEAGAESKTPARPSEPAGAQPSNTAAQRLPFPRDGTACRAEGGARQLPRHAHPNARAKPSPSPPEKAECRYRCPERHTSAWAG
jgi:hypothetical protein